jgi:hypothetical protein
MKPDSHPIDGLVDFTKNSKLRIETKSLFCLSVVERIGKRGFKELAGI